jgi:hypothetical protein
MARLTTTDRNDIKAATNNTILREAVKLSQGWRFTHILRVQPAYEDAPDRVRVVIELDSYVAQSYARVHVWDGTEWQLVHSIDGAQLDRTGFNYTATPKIGLFAKPEAELLRVAFAVMGIE